MFALDWEELDEHDDHLPYEERGWVKRLRERQKAAEEFDRRFPNIMEKLGRQVALDMQALALEVLLDGGKR